MLDGGAGAGAGAGADVLTGLVLSAKDRAIRRALAVASLPPPTDGHVHALRQLLLIGLVDQVARKVPPGTITEGSRRRRLTAYQSCNESLSEYLYLHPSSACHNPDPAAALPEFITFCSLTRSEGNSGETIYMNTVTPINPAWLSSVLGSHSSSSGAGAGEVCPLLRYAPPLTSPSP